MHKKFSNQIIIYKISIINKTSNFTKYIFYLKKENYLIICVFIGWTIDALYNI